jgi:hypothetical protein
MSHAKEKSGVRSTAEGAVEEGGEEVLGLTQRLAEPGKADAGVGIAHQNQFTFS